jgi:hypothetical protein
MISAIVDCEAKARLRFCRSHLPQCPKMVPPMADKEASIFNRIKGGNSVSVRVNFHGHSVPDDCVCL